MSNDSDALTPDKQFEQLRILQRGLEELNDGTAKPQALDHLPLLSQAIEKIPEGIAVSDLEGKLIFLNSAFAAAHGHTAQGLVGRNVSVLHPPSQLPHVEAAHRQLLNEGFFQGELLHLRPDGSTFVALVSKALLRGSDHRPSSLVMTCRDITASKHAQERLRESEERFRQFADAIDDLVIIQEAHDGSISYVNPAFQEIFGYDVEALLEDPMSFLQYVDPAHRQLVAKALDGEFSSNRAGQNLKTYGRIIRSDGTERWTHWTVLPIRDASGVVLRYVVFVRDVTEQKKMEAQISKNAENLETLVRERTEEVRKLEKRQMQLEKLASVARVAASVAHEINNPLAGIRNSMILMKDIVARDHPYREFVNMAIQEVDRISDIVIQMHQLYRPQSQDPAWTDLGNLTKDVCRLLELASDKRRVPLQVEVAPDLPKARLCASYFKQALFNIILNAIQASTADQRVEINVSHEASNFVISVSDSGHGITPDAMPHIFEPFFSTKHGNKESGMGLGLSVSHGLVTSLGGEIQVQSSPGQGTKFVLYLPKYPGVPE